MGRKHLILAVVFALAAVLPRHAVAAQRQSEATPVTTQPDADETRQQLDDIFKQYPPSLPDVLKLDPTLLGNSTYLQPYPALAAFLAKHPEIGHNPTYFLADFGNRGPFYSRQTSSEELRAGAWRSLTEAITIIAVVGTVATGILLILKMVVDYRRWSRLTKVQTDAHTKLLDRFASNEDLLAYIQSPAGRRFLESSPIAIDSPRSLNAPFGRILWSTQAGAVLTVLGLGVETIARNAPDDIAGPVSAIGAIVIALGIGFLVSAVLAYVLSRRFGLVHPTAEEPRG